MSKKEHSVKSGHRLWIFGSGFNWPEWLDIWHSSSVRSDTQSNFLWFTEACCRPQYCFLLRAKAVACSTSCGSSWSTCIDSASNWSVRSMIRCRERKARERSTPLRQCNAQYTATRAAHRLSEITSVVFLSLACPILFVAICGAISSFVHEAGCPNRQYTHSGETLLDLQQKVAMRSCKR